MKIMITGGAGFIGSHLCDEFLKDSHQVIVLTRNKSSLDNISHILDHKSTLGSMLRVVFGYSSRPTLFELISYGSYFIFIFWLQKVTDQTLVKRSV